MRDEELNELKKQNLIQSEKDVKAFERLYTNLSRTDKSFELSDNFQFKMNKMLIQRKKEEKLEKFVLIAGAFIFLLATLIALVYSGAFDKSDVLGGMKWYIVIFFTLLYVFRKIEKKYLKTA